MKQISVTKRTFDCQDVTYEWIGGHGAIIRSYESGLKRGYTRIIGHILFYVYHVNLHFQSFNRRQAVDWTVHDLYLNPEWIYELQRAIFI